MLITCQECQAVYCIADKIVGSSGRMVKCAKCEHIWVVASSRVAAPLLGSYDHLLPIVYKPTMSKAFKVIPICLVFIILMLNVLFFPEFFMRFAIFKDLYEKCGIYDSYGLKFDSVSYDISGNEVLVQGLIRNSSDVAKLVPEIRYILLNSDKEVIFKFTQPSSSNLIEPNDSWSIATKIINVTDNAAYLQLDVGNKLELMLK